MDLQDKQDRTHIYPTTEVHRNGNGYYVLLYFGSGYHDLIARDVDYF